MILLSWNTKIRVNKLIKLSEANIKQRPWRPTFYNKTEFMPMDANDEIPINVKPTLQVLMPPLAPNSLAKMVGNRTKCAPSRLNEMHTSLINSAFLIHESFKFIIIGKVNQIRT